MSNFPQNSNLNQGTSSFGSNIPSSSLGSQPLIQGNQGFSQPSQGFTQPGVALIQQKETIIQPVQGFSQQQGQGFTQPGQSLGQQQGQGVGQQGAGYVWSNAYDQGNQNLESGSGHKKGLLEKIGLKKSHDTDLSNQDQGMNQGLNQGMGQMQGGQIARDSYPAVSGQGEGLGQGWNQQPGTGSNFSQMNQGIPSYGQQGATDSSYWNQGQGQGTSTGYPSQVQGQGSNFQSDNFRNIEQQQMNPQGQAHGHGLGGMLKGDWNTAKSEFQSMTHHQGTQPKYKGTLGSMNLGSDTNQENLGMGAYNQTNTGLQPGQLQGSEKDFNQAIGGQPFSNNRTVL